MLFIESLISSLRNSEYLSDNLNRDRDTKKSDFILRALIFNHITIKTLSTSHQLAEKYCEFGLKLSKRKGDLFFITVFQLSMGLVQVAHGNFNKVKYLLEKIETNLTKLNFLLFKGDYYHLKADYYCEKNTEKELLYLHQALKVFEEAGDEEGMGRIKFNIFSCNIRNNNLTGAEESGKSLLKLTIFKNNPIIKSKILNNLGAVSVQRGNLTEARNYFSKALTIAERFQLTRLSQRLRGNIGAIYYFEKSYKKARDIYLGLLEEFNKHDYYENRFIWLSNLSRCYFHLGKYRTAINFISKFIQLSEEYNLPYKKLKGLILLVELNFKLKDKQQIFKLKEQIKKTLAQNQLQSLSRLVYVPEFAIILLSEEGNLESEYERYLEKIKTPGSDDRFNTADHLRDLYESYKSKSEN